MLTLTTPVNATVNKSTGILVIHFQSFRRVRDSITSRGLWESQPQREHATLVYRTINLYLLDALLGNLDSNNSRAFENATQMRGFANQFAATEANLGTETTSYLDQCDYPVDPRVAAVMSGV